jgi:hypothetical protein
MMCGGPDDGVDDSIDKKQILRQGRAPKGPGAAFLRTGSRQALAVVVIGTIVQ